MSRNTNQKAGLSLAALVGLMMTTNALGLEITAAKHITDIKMGGDFRVRYDHEHYKKAGTADRGRFRTRLRLNLDFSLPNNLLVKTTLASGTGEQTSTNQSMTGLSTQKSIWIDQAYIDWKPVSSLNLRAGRMANPLWLIYSSDAIWDSDVNPEGFSQGGSWILGGKLKVFANALQMVTVERSGDVEDGYMFAEQVGTEFRLPLSSRMKLAYAYYDWKNTGESNFAQSKVQEGNRRATVSGSANTLLNPFGVNEVSGELSGWISRIPLSLQGTYLKNSRVKSSYAEKKDTGYQTGVIIGKAKDAKTWELAYFYKYVETDATVADISDSDFGGGGVNRMGHILWAAFSPTDWFNLKTKYFLTKNIDENLPGATGDINRVQIDAQVKF